MAAIGPLYLVQIKVEAIPVSTATHTFKLFLFNKKRFSYLVQHKMLKHIEQTKTHNITIKTLFPLPSVKPYDL